MTAELRAAVAGFIIGATLVAVIAMLVVSHINHEHEVQMIACQDRVAMGLVC